MALYTDGNISTLSDLQGHDSALLEVSNTEGIDLTSKLEIAEAEIGLEIEAVLLQRATIGIARTQLSQVVVTTGLRRWHTLHALALAYGDAYNSQFNDRYRGKWRRFARLAKSAADLFFQIGIGIVLQPIPRAKPPLVTLGAAGTAPAGTYLVQVAWRSAAGTVGAPSAEVVVIANNGEEVLVDAPDPPPTATAFDVFMAVMGTEATLQNAVPVPAGQVFALPDIGVVAGEPPSSGQAPDFHLYRNRI
ncbi:MAG: hypothetical protein ACRD44_16515, partial [Bryobacteraceae bacterium]